MPTPPPPNKDRAIALLLEGQPSAAVAAALDLSPRTVEGWRRALRLGQRGKRGPDRVPRGVAAGPQGIAAAVVSLLLEGERVAEICGALGVSHQSVYQTRQRWL